MAYSPQSFSVGQVLTKAQCDQIEINIRDHAHGSLGVSGSNLYTLLNEVSSRNTAVVSGTSNLLASIVISSVIPGDRIFLAAQATISKGAGTSQVEMRVETSSGTCNVAFYNNLTTFGVYRGLVSSGDLNTYSTAAIGKVNSAGTFVANLFPISGGNISVGADGGQIYGLLFRAL